MKKGILKKYLAFVLCTAMIVTFMPSSVFTLAEPQDEPAIEQQEGQNEEQQEVQKDQTQQEQQDNNKNSADGNVSPSDNQDTPSTEEPNDVPVVNNEPSAEGAPAENETGVMNGDDDTPESQASDDAGIRGSPALNAQKDGADPNGNDENNEDPEPEEETWAVTFYDRDGDVYETVKVEKGEAIGDLPEPIAREHHIAYWAIGRIVEGEQGTEIEVTGERIDSSFVPTEDTTIVPDYDKITHTVTFYEDDKTTVVGEPQTVDYTSNFCVNNIPQVPVKNGYSGKWVYSGGDFNNSVTVDSDMMVWAEYEETVFTVTYEYKVGDKTTTYQTDKYYKGDTLTLPSEPIEEGRDFIGWYDGDDKVENGKEVTGDLTLQGRFTDMYAVSFVVLNDDGSVKDTLSQYFRTAGSTIDVMPQNPFVQGKTFEKWVVQGSDPEEEVTANTVVNNSFTAVAKFSTIDTYKITVHYWYEKDNGEPFVFDTAIKQIASASLPYELEPPVSTRTDEEYVEGAPIYYASETLIEVTENDFDENREFETSVQYIKSNATYDCVHMLKNLNGNGYTEIDRDEGIDCVEGTFVTPTAKDFEYATLENAEGAIINQNSGQELKVYYTRNTYQLSYDTNGGSYVPGTSALYDSEITVSTATPTRDGYTFEGWYLDEGLTQPAGATVKLTKDTTIYAKWEASNVNYTIVYLFEKYNDTGTESSFKYDNSRDATAQAGSTVSAKDAPKITRKGWEEDTDRNNDSNVVVAADGSSVLYVYYKLTEYTFHFRPGIYYGYYDNYYVSATLNGESKTGNNNWSYTVTAKIGQDISNLWLNPSNGTFSSYGRTYNVQFEGWHGSDTVYTGTFITKRVTLTDDMLPTSGTTATYTATWLAESETYTVNYWLQNADDDDYTRSTEYSQTVNGIQGGLGLGAKDITGYTHNSSKDKHKYTGGWGSYIYEYNFYYDRNTYKIDYYYGSTNLKTISNVKFDATITSNLYNWTPTAAQCGVDSDYTFAGWYSDSGLTTPYTFSTMPASNLALYAKWTPPTFDVVFDVQGGTPAIETQTVEKYHKATRPDNPSRAGYKFDGWYASADGEELFDWAKQITEDTTIFAHWTREPLGYTVHYVDEDGNSLSPDKTVTNPTFNAGDEIAEQAIAIAGYRPIEGEKSVTLSVGEDNEITFVYTLKTGETSYTVKYLLEGTNKAVHEEKVVTVNDDTLSVIEFAVEATDDNGKELYPDAVQKELTLGADASKNVLVFYYSAFRSLRATVNFVDMNGDPIPGIESHTEILKVGKTFTLGHTPIAGWDFNKAVEGTGYSGASAQSSYRITDALVEQYGETGMEFTLFYQKRVTITANSASKQYDGEVLTLPEPKYSVEGVPESVVKSVAFDYENADDSLLEPKGRKNAGTAIVTPKNARLEGENGINGDYYTIRYISGTLEVTKINVTVRIEPDRWTGIIYDGTAKKVGFTNSSKTVEDYILISNDGYSDRYLNTIWNTIKGKVSHDSAGNYYVLERTDVCDDVYDLGFTLADMPEDENYRVNLYVRPGRVQILPRTITVKANGGSKPYDGTAITAESTGYTITSGTVADGDEISVALSGSQTDLGNSPATVGAVSITRGEGDEAENVTSNYNIIKENGTLTITPNTSEYVITVTGKDASYQYNGSEQSVNGYTVSEYDPKITFTGLAQDDAKATAKGTDAGTYTMTMTKDDFSASSDYYTNIKIEVDPGTLTISKKTDEYVITVKGNSATKVYNTEEQKVNGYTVSEHDPSITVTGPAQNDAKATAKGTNAGTYTMTMSEADFTATSDNYDKIKIVVEPGTLEITPITDEYEITVTGKSDSKVYNTQEQKISGYTVSEYDPSITFSGLEQDDAKATAKGTNAGTYTMAMTKGDFSATSVNYSNIKVTVVPGTLEITPITDEYEITVTGNSDSKVYNTQEQSINGYEVSKYDPTITLNGPAQDDAKATAKGTDVGTYTMTMTKDDFTASSVNYTNIKVTVVPGTLEITPITDEYEIKVTGNSDSKVYNTQEQSVSGYTVSKYDPTITLNGPAQDDAKATAKGTDVGTYTMTMTKDDFTASSVNYTNIKVTVVPGTLEITPITDEYEITVTGNSDSKVYNTQEQSVSGYEVSKYDSSITFTGIAQDDAKATAKGTDAGSYTMTMSGSDFSATSKNYKKIKITVVPGTLEITPITSEYKITVTGNSATKVYNTKEQSVNGYTVSEYDPKITFTGIEQDDAKATAKGTNVGTYTMTMTKDDFSASSVNYTNIKITVVPGTLTIGKKTDEYVITVKGNTATQIYKGSEWSVNGYTVSEYDPSITFTGPAQNDAKVTAKGTNAGTYTMTMSESDFTATSDNYDKIKIVVEPGTLTITPIEDEYEIKVTGNTDSKVYNTKEQKISGYTVSEYDPSITFNGLEQDDAKATAKGTNVGTYTMAMTKDDFSASSVNYTNIKITVVPGTLEITPITDEYEITVTGNSDSKVYNTKEQSINGYEVSKYDPTITFNGPAQDDAKATAKGTNVGTYTMAMTKSDFTATSVNYSNIKVTVEPGTLEITPITDEYEIKVTGNSDSKVYNTQEQSVSGYKISKYDSTIELTGPAQDDAKATAKGTNVGTYTMAMTKSDFTATSVNYSNIKVTVVPGTLEITPITDEYEITVTGNSATKVYNTQEQSVSGYKVSKYDSTIELTGPAQNDAKATAKGTDAGTYTMTMTKDDFTATSVNYSNIKITVVPGTLEITPITSEYEITVTGKDASYQYNGSEQSVNGYTVSEYDPKIRFTGLAQDDAKATAKGTDVGSYKMTMSEADFTATSVNYSNIKVTVVPGTLTISKKTDEYVITVKGNSATQIYKGSEWSVSGYTVSEYDPSITFTGPAQDDAKATAKGTNAGTYTMTMSESDFTATSDNYDKIRIVVEPGTLEITPITDEYEIKVTGNSDSKVYNTKEQKVNGYTVSEYDPSITFSGLEQDDAKATAKGTNAGTYTMAMTKDDFSATSVNYSNIKITVEPGTLEITPITDEYEIKVTGKTDSKVYNTQEQKVNGYTVSEYDPSITFTGIAQDDAKATAKGTDVGTYTMTMTKADFTATSVNYSNIKVTVVPGTLEITPITDEYEIKVTGNSDSKVYNTQEQSVSGYTVSKYDPTITLNGPAQDDAKATAKGTDVGTYTMTMTKDDFTASSVNYTNIKVTVVPGTLEITPITDEYEITVTGNSDSKVYNTQEQSVSGYEVSKYDPSITFTGIAQDDAKATAKGTDAGTYTMTMTKDDFSATSKNYKKIKITVVPGTLEITPITSEYKITVTGNSATKVYNTKEQSVNGYTVSEYDPKITFTGIEQDDAKATAKGTNVGTYTMTMTAADFSASSVNYTNIKITVVPGTLTISKKTDEYVITVKGNTSTQIYKGSEWSVSGYTVSEYDPSITFTGLAQDDAKVTAKGTNAGTYTMTMSEADFTATSDNYDKIKIVVEPGTLTITPIEDEYEIKVTGNTDSKVYNTKEQSVNGYTVSEYDSSITFNGLEQDDAKATAKGTNVGTYTMAMTKADFTATSKNYTNIKVTVVPGTLEITPAKITDDPEDPDDPTSKRFDVSRPSDVTYNGQAQEQPVTVTDTMVGELAKNKDFTLSYTPAVNVGEVTVTITGIGNYEGTITRKYNILPAAITIKADSKNKVYGTADPELTVSIVEGKLYGNDEIKYDISRDKAGTKAGENAGTYAIKLKDGRSRILRALNLVKNNYDITFEDGNLTITKAPLTITTPSASRAYNGNALTAPKAKISGLVNGDKATVTAIGSQTKVGSSSNTYSIKWTKGSASNYNISEKLGTLTVTVAPAPTPTPTPTPDDDDNPGGGGRNPNNGGNNPDGNNNGVVPGDNTPEVIPDEPTPTADPEPAEIPDEPTPLAGGTWALLNLIAAIVTALGAIVALFRKKEDEDEDEQYDKSEDEDDNRGKKMLAAKIVGALAGVAAPVTFLLTEDMTQQMAMTDKWTILMAVMLVVQVVAAVFNKRASELDDEEEESAEEAAN